jgi:iron complex outermembrane recepter protein
LEEVLVTARRRIEPVQRTPLSIVALTAEDLEARSVTHLRSLQYHVPNLTLAPSQNVGDAAVNVFIRGVGQEDFIVAAEPGVAMYLDGVYLARSFGSLLDVLDVERIEVLRGPQGTLYGRNSIGGAIQIISAPPSFDSQQRASLELGNLGRREIRGMLNGPLGDQVAIRAAVAFIDRDGYLRRFPAPGEVDPGGDRRPEGDLDSSTGRLQVRWRPTEGMTADVSLDAARRRTRQGATHVDQINPLVSPLPVINGLIGQGNIPGPPIANALAPDDLLASYASDVSFVEQDIRGISGTLTRQSGQSLLRAIAAYRSMESNVATETDGGPLNVFNTNFHDKQHQESLELQWNFDADRFDVTLGAFAFSEHGQSIPVPGIGLGEVLYTCNCFYTSLPSNAVTQQRHISTDSLAAYAQSTVKISPLLSSTVGFRASKDSKKIDANVFALDSSLQPSNRLLGTGANQDEWQSNTWRAGLDLQATDDVMLYGSLARGFKSGGFNARPTIRLPNLGLDEFDPETADTLEFGLRSEWLERRLRFNATAFHTHYEDMQLRRQLIVGGLPVTIIENAAKSHIRGFEIELAAVVAPGLDVGFLYGLVNADYLDVGTAADISTSSHFQRTPEHSWSATIDYRRGLGSGTLSLNADYSGRAREQFQTTPSPYDQAAYGLLGAHVKFDPGNPGWSVELFGTNLTDQQYRSAGRFNSIDQTGFAVSSMGPPREFGARFTLQR